MPERGRKRRISESTCDSSNCVFCVNRFPHPPDTVEQPPQQQESDSSSETEAASDFHSWLQTQNSEKALLAAVDFSKMGLPPHQLEAYSSSEQGCNIKEAKQKQDSCSGTDSFYHHLESQQPSPASLQASQPDQDQEVPWSWSESWQDHTEPVPAVFREVASFQQPASSNNTRQHTADILCGLEFSPDARFLASAGVAKHVCQLQSCNM